MPTAAPPTPTAPDPGTAGSFLVRYDQLADSNQPATLVVQQQTQLLIGALLGQPDQLLAELREKRPILVLPGSGPAVVTRFRDVVEVAGRDSDFTVDPYGFGMKLINGGPNFLLGMNQGPEYERSSAVLHLAVRQNDLDGIRSLVAEVAGALLDAARLTGEIDLVEGFARRVPAVLAERYLGIPGPVPELLMSWGRAMFAALFTNLAQDQRVAWAAMAAGTEFRAYVQQLVTAAAADTGSSADTVLHRLLRLRSSATPELSDSDIVNDLIGCVVGMFDNTATATVNALDVLLDRPEDLRVAVDAAVRGDDATLLRSISEALRMRPPAPILVRMTKGNQKVARGTDHETVIPDGKLVLVCNGSAMRDERELEQPETFRLDRPLSQYLLFGSGMHSCLGKYLAQVQVVEMVKAVLRRHGVRRADGASGALTHVGVFPASFRIRFGIDRPAPVDAVAHPLTLVLPLRSGSGQAVRTLLQPLTGHPQPLTAPLDGLGTVHFARFTVLEPDRLMLIASYDGAKDDCLRSLATALDQLLGPLLEHVVDAPARPVRDHVDEFVTFAAQHDIDVFGSMYSAYPELTTRQVLAQPSP